jgi:hypothetical protein
MLFANSANVRTNSSKSICLAKLSSLERSWAYLQSDPKTVPSTIKEADER